MSFGTINLNLHKDVLKKKMLRQSMLSELIVLFFICHFYEQVDNIYKKRPLAKHCLQTTLKKRYISLNIVIILSN